jgi:hypothetical protein
MLDDNGLPTMIRYAIYIRIPHILLLCLPILILPMFLPRGRRGRPVSRGLGDRNHRGFPTLSGRRAIQFLGRSDVWRGGLHA